MNVPAQASRSITTRQIVYTEIYKNIPRIISLLILMLLATLVNIFSPLLFRMLIDDAIPNMNIPKIVWILAGMVLVPVGNMGLFSLQNYLRFLIGASVEEALRQRLFEHVLKSQLQDVERMKTGEIVYRITSSCGQVGSVYICDKLLPLISNVVLLTGYIGIMFTVCWQLALIASIAVPLSYILAQCLRNHAYSVDKEYMNILESGHNYLQEVFAGLRTVRSFNGETFEFGRWRKWLADHIKVYVRAHVSHYAHLFTSEFINNLLIGIVYGFGAFLVVNKQLSIGSLVAFVIYVPGAYAALRVIFQSQVGLGEARAAAEKIDSLFTMEQEPRDGKELPPSPDGSMMVEFKDVSFNYGRGDFSVQHLSFCVQAREFIGIVGATGGGKSTVLDLLMGFYQPQSGVILINGINMQDLSLEILRRRISLVPQDIFLWNSSIRDNILYPQKSILPDELTEAAQMAQIDDFIHKLPQGYNTMVGERGQALSGGERQRLAICRALLQETSLLLLDEATSALDAVTELKLRDAIQQIKKRSTIIAVAHRLSTVMQADRILVLDQGQLVESGTPQELIKKGGLFNKLYEAQQINQ